MAQILFRFTLSNDTYGIKQISEPDGWNKIKIILERDKEFHSVVEMIETPFIFYKSNGVHDGGMEYLDQMKLNDQVTISIEASEDDGNYWDEFFNGLIDIQSKQIIDSRKVQYVITRGTLFTKFKSRYDTSVDLRSIVDLDNNPISQLDPITLLLPPQKIDKKYSGSLSTHRFPSPNSSTGKPYFTVDFDKEEFNEITETYHYSVDRSLNSEIPFEKFNLDFDGELEIDSKITFSINSSSPTNTPASAIGEIEIYVQINGIIVDTFSSADRSVSESGYFNPSYPPAYDTTGSTYSISGTVTEFTLQKTYPLKKSDAVRIYGKQLGTAGGILMYGSEGWGAPADDATSSYEGLWDPTLGLFPTSAPLTGPAMLGREWQISKDGALQGIPVKKGWYIRAESGTPGQVTGNWYVGEKGIKEGLWNFAESYLNAVHHSSQISSEAESFFVHDVAGAILDRIIGQEQKFNSNYLGSTQTLYKTYDEDGCGWPFVLVRGLQLRQYLLSEKPLSISFKSWWDGINPIANLGLGYETINGIEVIEVEEKAAFYDEDPILTLSWVNNIVESFDKDYIFNKIKIGYKKWQSEDISGIDDPQTSHEYSTLFETVGKSIDIESEFIAASLAIETTRRTTRILSADYKFDNDTFIIAINPDPLSSPAGDYEPELDENFDSITNLLNPETRYNSTLTPARNLARWANYLIGCLQDYLTSSIKFNKGEGNFDMISDYSGSAPGICFNLIADSLSEKGDLSLTAYGSGLGHLFTPYILEFTFPLSYSNYKLLRDNRKRAIAVSESDSSHTICFIKRMEYDIIKSRAKFIVWKK